MLVHAHTLYKSPTWTCIQHGHTYTHTQGRVYTRHVHKPTTLPRLAFVPVSRAWPTNLGYSCFETRILRLQLNRADLETNTPSSNFEGFKEGSTYRGSKPRGVGGETIGDGWMDGWMDGCNASFHDQRRRLSSGFAYKGTGHRAASTYRIHVTCPLKIRTRKHRSNNRSRKSRKGWNR